MISDLTEEDLLEISRKAAEIARREAAKYREIICPYGGLVPYSIITNNNFMSQEKTLVFHYPPKQVKEYVEQWKQSAEKDKSYKPEHRAMLDDILQLINVAIKVLQPNPVMQVQKGKKQ